MRTVSCATASGARAKNAAAAKSLGACMVGPRRGGRTVLPSGSMPGAFGSDRACPIIYDNARIVYQPGNRLPSMLLRHADAVYTCDDARRVIRDGYVHVE